jgi:hypothetical protein
MGSNPEALAVFAQLVVLGVMRSRLLPFLLALLLGLVAASPFATRRAVGSGEAYNYRLALADGVTQIRAGVIPPLIGQTEYAWNGRIHPLREAPYLIYGAAALDLVTFHRLSFWELQNLSLGLSLVGAALAAYGALRFATRCPPWLSALLAGIYGLCPALLMAADVQDLYMTVHAAVWVPLALGLTLRQATAPRVRYDLALAAVLSLAWLAHPPVALWLTAAVGVIRGGFFLRHPSKREGLGLGLALLAGAALSAFEFASVGTLNSDLGYLAARNDWLRGSSTDAILHNLMASLPQCLLPVSADVDRPGDLQLGYSAAALLLGVLALTGWRRPGERSGWSAWGRPSVALAAVALLLLTFLLPIPGLTRWLWLHLPLFVHSITNIWPTQRLYLIATGLAVMAGGSAAGSALAAPGRGRRCAAAILGLALLAWTAAEARPFLRAGWRSRWTADATRRSEAPTNRDLTVTSYAFVGTPPNRIHGVTDPRFDFRILRGAEEIASPIAATLHSGPIVTQGTFAGEAGAGNDRASSGRPTVVLQPHRRYVLSLDLDSVPVGSSLWLTGSTLDRSYELAQVGAIPAAGPRAPPDQGFVIWTDDSKPETVQMGLSIPPPAERLPLAADGPTQEAPPTRPGRFTLREVTPDQLPIEVASVFPLRATVHAPEPGCDLDTCRRYVAGYRATVDGQAIPVTRSPLGNVMIPVPEGTSVVTLDYAGSGLVRAAFWLSAVSWLGLITGLVARVARGRVGFPGPALRPARVAAPTGRVRRRVALGIAAAAAVAGCGLAARAWADYRSAVGPVRLRVLLPNAATGRTEALLSTGHRGAGMVVLIAYPDRNHVRFGADIWGQLDWGPPLAVDYSRAHEVVVEASGFYPLDHPAIRRLPPEERERLRRTVRIELNGREALTVVRNAFESRVGEVAIGRSTMGGSHSDRAFSGSILGVERQPPRPDLRLPPGQAVRLEIPAASLADRRPAPLLALGPEGEQGVLFARRLSPGRLELGWYLPRTRVSTTTEQGVAPGAPVIVRCSVGRTAGDPLRPELSVDLNGHHVLGPRPERLIPPASPPWAQVGANPSGWADCARWWFEAGISARVVPAFDAHRTDGPLSLIVRLPRDRPGRSEPLLVTGQPGAGDFVYVVYRDATHVQFGVDHWGRFSRLSEVRTIDYAVPHLIRLSFAPLFADAASPPGAPSAGTSGLPELARPPQSRSPQPPSDAAGLRLELDGQVVLQARPYEAYPSRPGEVSVGQNRIGGSTCDSRFTGVILLSFRNGRTGPPDPVLP